MASEEAPTLERAKEIALRYLAFSARTESQVRARLAKGDCAGHADAVVAWLRALGYLDDAAYARARAAALLTRGRAGPRLAARRLQAAGIEGPEARSAVAAALAEAGGEGEPELALCRALAAKRARGAALASLDDRARRRIASFLLGRGFAAPVVARVLGIYEDG
jgi:regulatory protein